MGTIGPNAANDTYFTSVDWNARILPVRVLGKCSGDDAETADARAWAAGIAVPAAPVDPNPAQVINPSLGDPGDCPRFLQDTISAALAHGVTRAIVASAGNQGSDAPHFPSGSAGVISVAASTFAGNRATYSNFGARIDIAAPGGNGHCHGRDATECAGTMAENPSFILEAPEFFHRYPPSAGACAAGTGPVYRVYSNRADANHHYAVERSGRDAMVAKGWLAEGDGPDLVAMCAPASP
jgi:subtilisin family serine protease